MDRLKNALRRDFWIMLLDVVAVNIAYFLALAFRYGFGDYLIYLVFFHLFLLIKLDFVISISRFLAEAHQFAWQ